MPVRRALRMRGDHVILLGLVCGATPPFGVAELEADRGRD